MNINNIIIPGPAQAVLTGVLEMPIESSLHEMVVEIERLKMAAAEGPIDAPNFADDLEVGRGNAPAEKKADSRKRKAASRRQKADTHEAPDA